MRATAALTVHKARQANERRAADDAWHDNDLVFCHENGAPYTSDQLNWRFSKMTRRAGIGRWHAHEGRHTALSIMSSNGVPIREISNTVGHKSTPRHRDGLPTRDRARDPRGSDRDGRRLQRQRRRYRRGQRKRQEQLGTWLGTFQSNRGPKIVELRGFEPLTFCMPCSMVSSDGVALGPVTAVQSRFGVWGRLARSGEIWGRWCLVWSWFSGPPGQGRPILGNPDHRRQDDSGDRQPRGGGAPAVPAR